MKIKEANNYRRYPKYHFIHLYNSRFRLQSSLILFESCLERLYFLNCSLDKLKKNYFGLQLDLLNILCVLSLSLSNLQLNRYHFLRMEWNTFACLKVPKTKPEQDCLNNNQGSTYNYCFLLFWLKLGYIETSLALCLSNHNQESTPRSGNVCRSVSMGTKHDALLNVIIKNLHQAKYGRQNFNRRNHHLLSQAFT